MFDGNVRGWLWMLLIALLIVFGTRLHGIVAGAALVMAQFFVSMIWWWLVRPRAERQRSFSGLWLIFGVLLFGLLVVGDNFTYEYAFVRDFDGQFRLPQHGHPAAAARLSRLRAAAAAAGGLPRRPADDADAAAHPLERQRIAAGCRSARSWSSSLREHWRSGRGAPAGDSGRARRR